VFGRMFAAGAHVHRCGGKIWQSVFRRIDHGGRDSGGIFRLYRDLQVAEFDMSTLAHHTLEGSMENGL
jgi:hypothetical protein